MITTLSDGVDSDNRAISDRYRGLSLVANPGFVAAMSMRGDPGNPQGTGHYPDIWTEEFAGKYSDAKCVRCRDESNRATGVLRGRADTTGIFRTKIGYICRCVIRTIATESAYTLHKKRCDSSLRSASISTRSGVGQTIAHHQPSGQSASKPNWTTSLNYVVDFSIILNRFLNQDQLFIWEAFVMQQHPHGEVADYLRLSKDGFFNELRRVQAIVAQQVVERLMFPSHTYMQTKAERATPNPRPPVAKRHVFPAFAVPSVVTCISTRRASWRAPEQRHRLQAA